MKVNLIFILLIILLIKIKAEKEKFKIDYVNNIPKIRRINSDEDIIISTNISESIVNNEKLNISNKEEFINRVFFNYEDSIGENSINSFYYFYFRYDELCPKEYIIMEFFNNFNNENNETNKNEIFFTKVNFTKLILDYNITYIISINNISFPLIILDYIDDYFQVVQVDNITSEEMKDKENKNYNDLIDDENECFDGNSLDSIEGHKFICKLDYILFGHEDLKKDDVYLAKEIDEDLSLAFIDNFLNYSVFPGVYFDYFFTSFFSELNDGCEKNEFKLEEYANSFYYITCPKKKIEIYTKRRKLSIIINNFAYKMRDLFKDSLEFLEKNENDDKYYFNIVFEKDRKNFILGIGFIKNKTIGYYNNKTYIFADDRNNYTEDLTDINSKQFEKWLYILTTFSFTFLLLIFTILGCMHSRKVNKELKEMLK